MRFVTVSTSRVHDHKERQGVRGVGGGGRVCVRACGQQYTKHLVKMCAKHINRKKSLPFLLCSGDQIGIQCHH